MKIILLKDVEDLGKAGDTKEVSDGYARNYLLPNKFAEPATKEAIGKATALKLKKEKLKKEELTKIQEMADQIQKMQITINSKEKEGKLFGSVTKKDIVKELKQQKIIISDSSIEMDGPIKKAGEHEIKIKLDHGIETVLNLLVKGSE